MALVRRFWAGSPRLLVGALALAVCAFSAAGDLATVGLGPEPIAAVDFQAATGVPQGDVRAGRPVRPLPPATVASPGLQIVKVLRRVPHARGAEAASFGGRNALAAQPGAGGLRVSPSARLRGRQRSIDHTGVRALRSAGIMRA